MTPIKFYETVDSRDVPSASYWLEIEDCALLFGILSIAAERTNFINSHRQWTICIQRSIVLLVLSLLSWLYILALRPPEVTLIGITDPVVIGVKILFFYPTMTAVLNRYINQKSPLTQNH